ncbi:MAG: TonB-dependent siderophore receptor [Pseudomonadota bacterium]
MLHRQLLVRGTLTAILVLSAATAAHAQDSADTETLPQKEDLSVNELPTVKVTATKEKSSTLDYLKKDSSSGALGDKTVLDTPFSVTIVDSHEIAERGAKSVAQIFANDPSVYSPSNSSTTDWWGTQIRGLGVRSMYVDDIPMLLYWGGDFPIEASESVTALKGLTGFMYGFAEPGGALSYRLKRPTAEPETTATVGWRNPRLFTAHVDSSHQFGESFSVRANVATEQGTAYNASEINRNVASVAIDKQFGSAFKWETTFLYEYSKNTGEPIQFYIDGYDYAGSGGKLPEVTYNYDNFNVENSYYRTKTMLASTSLQWRINDQWNLKQQIGFSRKSHQSNKSFANLMNLAGDYEGQMYNFAGQLDNLFTQTMLQGNVTTGIFKHELVGGFGVQRSTDRWASEFYWANDFNGNLYVEQLFRSTRTPNFTLTPISADTRQHYAFASDTVHMGEHWQAIAGVRFTKFQIRDLDGDPATDSAYKINSATPTLALIYKPAANTSIYASYVEGLEPGTRVAFDATPPYANAGDLLEATISKQIETGIKYDSGKLAYTLALFQIERANQIDELRGADRYLTQEGQLTYRGVELISNYQVTRNLNLGMGAIYLDATIDNVSTANAAIEGNTPANAPKWQVVGSANYTVPGINGLKVHGNWRYFGATYVNDDNTGKVPGRAIINTGLTYDFELQGQWLTLTSNVNNLLNKKYWANGGWGAGNVGEARNYALTLAAKF